MNITTIPIELKVSVPLTLKPAYRYLAYGEIIQNGDQYNDVYRWTKSRRIGRAVDHAFADTDYRRPIPATLDTHAIYTKHRPIKARVTMIGGLSANVLDFPIPEPVIPKPEAGDRYRFLEAGELILEGDEVCGWDYNWWSPPGLAGRHVPETGFGNYRRKIVADPLSEVLKTLKEISALDSESSKKIEALITKLES